MTRVAVKIGSNVLTSEDGLPNTQLIRNLVQQIAKVQKSGINVILISSGAVAAGRSVLKKISVGDTVSERQLLSSMGQVQLMSTYSALFAEMGIKCAQVLVTSQDFKDRQHYLNIRNCIEVLFKNNIVPIVNENDVVAVTELMFTDNDELAGLVAAIADVRKLLVLTNVDGVYDGNPQSEKARIIEEFDESLTPLDSFQQVKKSTFGRGGIITKCRNAIKVSKLGIEVIIANGKKPGIITDIVEGAMLGTRFRALEGGTSSLKKWVAHSNKFTKGEIIINEGAEVKLRSASAVSLLPIGITKIEGQFKKGDIIKIINGAGQEIGLGKTQYGYKHAQAVLGEKNQKPIIHYDYLYLH